MPRLYKCKPGSRVYKRTPDHILEKARVENAAGASQTDVCKKYLITRSVFQKYLKEHQSGECRRTPGGQTILSHETEKIIVDHLLHVSKWGFPFDTLDLRITVKRLLDKKGTKIPKFKDNVPGEDWAFSFMRRHKDRIKNRLCQNISKKRAGVGHETINLYFQELEKSLDGVPPENIINYNETNLTDDPGRRRMIFKRGARYPERILNGTKASTSLMLAGTASGEVLPVYVVYKSDHLWNTWVEGGPPKARYNRTRSGWFDHVTFVDWFRRVALPYCKKRIPGSKKVLIGDNLSSHFSNEVLRECERNNISFVCLPPNSTHLCQPLDVAYFSPMKRQWRNILTTYKQSNRKNVGSVPKDQFPRLLKQLMGMPNQKQNLISGFCKCGIVPLDKTKILNRLPRDPSQGSEANSSVSEVFTEHLQQLRGENQTDPVRKMRRKRMNVVPGQSISTIDEEQSDQEAGPSTISMKNCGNEAQDTEFISDISTSESEEKNQSPKDKENQRTTRNIFSLFYP